MPQEKNDKDKYDEKRKRKTSTTAYPKNTLKEALRIAESIQTNNAGKDFNRLDLALSLEYSPESSGFRTLITSSTRYGLTSGSYAADKITLTELGRAIVLPRSDEEKNSAILRSLKNIDLFKQTYEKYDQNRFPRDELLKNSLIRDLDIPPDSVEQCLKIMKQNLIDWGVLIDMQGGQWIRLDKLSTSVFSGKTAPSQSVAELSEEERIVGDNQTVGIEIIKKNVSVPRVFISHSKNNKILGQIKTILTFGQFESIVAEEMETTSIPIPEKIFGAMHECNCAIINISADEQEKDAEGNFKVNPNVLIEIGAAFLRYNKRVILLADKRVRLPSNLQGLYKCEYEGDELSFSVAMKLQEALTNFRKIDDTSSS